MNDICLLIVCDIREQLVVDSSAKKEKFSAFENKIPVYLVAVGRKDN